MACSRCSGALGSGAWPVNPYTDQSSLLPPGKAPNAQFPSSLAVLKPRGAAPISTPVRAAQRGPFNFVPGRMAGRADPQRFQEVVTMRSFDFSPFFRSTVGFDHLFDLLDQVSDNAQSYPPYNIERTGENAYRVTLAVAGFAEKDLGIEVSDGVLTVAGKREDA